MSFREKSAWIAVVTTLIIWSYYFATVWQAYWAKALSGPAILTLFLICLAVSVVILLALNLISARLGRQQFGADLDELERSVDARANAFGARLLEWLVLAVAAASPWASTHIAVAYPADPAGTTAIVIANTILFVVIVSQLVHELVHIVHRRMMA